MMLKYMLPGKKVPASQPKSLPEKQYINPKFIIIHAYNITIVLCNARRIVQHLLQLKALKTKKVCMLKITNHTNTRT